MYTKPLSITFHILSHTTHLSMTYTCLLHLMQYFNYFSILCHVNACVTVNLYRLKDNKMELVIVTSKRTKKLKNICASITIRYHKLHSGNRSTTCTSNSHLTSNVFTVTQACNFPVTYLTTIRRFSTDATTATLIPTFIPTLAMILTLNRSSLKRLLVCSPSAQLTVLDGGPAKM